MILNKCLQAFPAPTKGTHSAAEELCRNDGGTLVNIRSVIDNRATSVFASNHNLDKFWIGTFCFGNDTSKCVYDDYSGSVSDYNSFAAGMPLVTGISDGCVYMLATGSQAGRWISSKCKTDESIGSVCEVPAYMYDPEYSNKNQCSYFDGYCYIKQGGEISTMVRTCSQIGGFPLSIRSKRENDFVYGLNSNNYEDLLLGATRIAYNREESVSKYAWMDGAGWNEFENIDISADNSDNDARACLAMDRWTGLWKSVYCGTVYNYYCKVPLPPNPAVDISNCNSTVLMAPAVITSFGYPDNSSPPPCTWKIATVGAYKLRIAFKNGFSSGVTVYDGDGNNIGTAIYKSIVAPTNYITVVQTGRGQFYADILPY
ncbi:hypothetical protein CAEBREN_22241 [Caenorhabditis brenneri]|uniref:C-type lectin domain-containing protein n=1 Tax=Caenorhabditis brenneri TaxID=135651 RepID=G0PLH4_CAEBE|nr:hypothetical protein CAEBREN_22241 [Caenorhabditis brenneri]